MQNGKYEVTPQIFRLNQWTTIIVQMEKITGVVIFGWKVVSNKF